MEIEVTERNVVIAGAILMFAAFGKDAKRKLFRQARSTKNKVVDTGKDAGEKLIYVLLGMIGIYAYQNWMRG